MLSVPVFNRYLCLLGSIYCNSVFLKQIMNLAMQYTTETSIWSLNGINAGAKGCSDFISLSRVSRKSSDSGKCHEQKLVVKKLITRKVAVSFL